MSLFRVVMMLSREAGAVEKVAASTDIPIST